MHVGRLESQTKHQPHFQTYSPAADEMEAKRRLDAANETFHSETNQPVHLSHRPMAPHDRRFSFENTRETEVQYVLAKQHKSINTGEQLGFPAFSLGKELLGFYREESSSSSSGVSTIQTKFIPVNQLSEFGPKEMLQASEILNEAFTSGSDTLHSLQQYGSISKLLDHCKVYVWSRGSASSSHRAK
jgi:hypothetical protein